MDRLRHPRVGELIHHEKRKPEREWEREKEGRCKISDGVTSEWGRGQIDSRYKARDVGVKGHPVLWEGIAGLRLLHVSLLGLQGSSAWKWVLRSAAVPDIESPRESSPAFVFSRTSMRSSSHLASEFAKAYNDAWKIAHTPETRVVCVF